MQEFEGRVAVITGAASGIGRALAQRFAEEGMRVVLADVEREPLDAAVAELRQAEHEAIAVLADVSRADEVQRIRDEALGAFGAVHVVCNNAGVSGGGGAVWETSEQDWDWVLGVNLGGVIHGVRTFVPLLLEQGEPGWIVNTASVLGLQSGGGSPYGVSKHAVVRLSEGLYYDLQARDAAVGCSVLCPGMVATNIVLAERNRPPGLERLPDADDRVQQRAAMHRLFTEEGMAPPGVAAAVVEAIREERFYVLTHPVGVKERLRSRLEDILAERNPSPLPPPQLGEAPRSPAASSATSADQSS